MPRSLMLALASAIALGFAAAAPAAAAERAQRVTYAELDLDAGAGVDSLLRRIENAAQYMCGDRSGPMPLHQRMAVRRCVRDKSAQAVADVNHSNVTARFYNRDPSIIVASR
ncbi:MAG TPA: UrcA family protein [Candidatus Binatia bacterium]|nr:UrcA family protein [Candidatus Binatia bacterium]